MPFLRKQHRRQCHRAARRVHGAHRRHRDNRAANGQPDTDFGGQPSWSTAIATSAEPIGLFKKSFLALLKMAGVTHSADGRMRTPYSLRHTYATERLNAGVQEYHLAKNMGTSVAMLEKH